MHDDAETARFDAFIQSTDQHAHDRIAFAEFHGTDPRCDGARGDDQPV
jgi:hypothetical protein